MAASPKDVHIACHRLHHWNDLNSHQQRKFTKIPTWWDRRLQIRSPIHRFLVIDVFVSHEAELSSSQAQAVESELSTHVKYNNCYQASVTGAGPEDIVIATLFVI